MGIEIDAASMRIDFAQVMDNMRAARAKAAASVRAWVKSSMTLVASRVGFVDDKVLETDDGRRLTGERMFIASGSRFRQADGRG